jgi:Helicase associated domain
VNKKKFDTQFETMIAKLQDFAHQNGHCNVLKSDKEHRDLWNWMLRIRADYKRLSVPEERDKCRLSTLQMQRLTELGFSFLTVAYKSWDERLEDLKAYQASGQDINKIPTLNHELGEFVGRCRKEYKHFLEGRRTAMTAERAQKLEAIGFDWNMHLHRDTATYPKPKSWEQRYEQLKEYYLQHGDTLVNKNYTDGLGRWVADQRKAFKAYASSKKSSLNPEKVGKLVEIGFIVDANVYKKKRQKVEEPAEPDPAPEMCWYI